MDDPRYFAHPDRAEAGILWLSKGYVEYLVPNILPAGQKIDEITFTMETVSYTHIDVNKRQGRACLR